MNISFAISLSALLIVLATIFPDIRERFPVLVVFVELLSVFDLQLEWQPKRGCWILPPMGYRNRR